MNDPSGTVRQGYDRCAARYAAQRDLSGSESYLKRLLARLPARASVLDAGCGAGVPVARYLLAQGCSVTGIDLSGAQIHLARANCPAGHFALADMTALPLPDASYDAVVSFYAIFHVPRGLHLGLLSDFARLLRPGGYLLATLGASEWEGVEEFHGVPMYWSHYGAERNLALLRQAGFELRWDLIDGAHAERHLIVLAQRAAAWPPTSHACPARWGTWLPAA